VCSVCGRVARTFRAKAHNHYVIVYPCRHANPDGMDYRAPKDPE